jgi:deoxycytidine triphosphate deaminase
MARILSDRDVRKLIGTVLDNAHDSLLNPNGIELRLGSDIRFLSTDEDKQLEANEFLRVAPGETVLISSLERLDFRNETVSEIFPQSSLMGLITPTTTMMREGIAQVSTKIDPGFRGILNWMIRNGSVQDLILGYGEPIFKLTLFLLDEAETPEVPYGDRERDSYQDSQGIAQSRRRIPASIPKKQMIGSSIEKLDPTKRLQEAGYPFNHIATELVELHGKFEVVSSDVRLLKDEFVKLDTRLSSKIESETSSLIDKINEASSTMLGKVKMLLTQRYQSLIGTLIAIAGLAAAGYTALLKSAPNSTQVYVFLGVAALALLVTLLVTYWNKEGS